jgi:hypothetical protein
MFAVLNRNACRNDVIGSRRRPGNRNRRLPIPHILAIARNPRMVRWPRDRVDLVAVTPMIFARIGLVEAINRHRVREFDISPKPHHWGKRKLKRDE